jgi:hypothetical protein
MRLAFVFVLLSAGVSLASDTITISRDDYNQVKTLVEKQADDIRDAKSRVSWTWGQLQDAQTQIAAVAKERDGYKAWGEDVQTKWVNAEQRVAAGQKRIWIDNCIFVALAAAAGIFFLIKSGIGFAI